MNGRTALDPVCDGVKRTLPSILLMAHGSKDPAGQRELQALEAAVQVAAGKRSVALGVLEYPGQHVPAIAEAADRLATSGARVIVAVPVLLLQAGHGKLDMPQQFAQARARHPEIDWRLAAPLMPHPLLRAIAQERLEQALVEQPIPPATVPDTEPAGDDRRRAETETAVLLVGRGSHDPAANSDLYKIARLLREEYGHGLVEACFISQAGPDVGEGIRRCIALGAVSIVVVPYFLHTGVLVQRIHTQVMHAQRRYPQVPMRVAAQLGNHANLTRLLLLRIREALVRMRVEPCFAGSTPAPGFLPLVAAVPHSHHFAGHHLAHEHEPAPAVHGHVTSSAKAFSPTQNERWYLRVTDDWAARLERGEVIGPDATSTERDVAFARRVLGLQPGTRVLETGCGWGRCTVELARLGCKVTGVDLSQSMVMYARRRLNEAGQPGDIRRATVRLLPEFPAAFDAVVGFRDDSPISADDELDNLRMLQSLAAALRPGGLLLFGTGDYPHRAPAYQRLARHTLNGEVVEEIRYDSVTGWSVNESCWTGPDGAVHLVRSRKHYTPDTLVPLLENAGLQLVATYADFDESCPYGAQPEGLIVVATKVEKGTARRRAADDA